jgi:hypothetical protein
MAHESCQATRVFSSAQPNRHPPTIVHHQRRGLVRQPGSRFASSNGCGWTCPEPSIKTGRSFGSGYDTESSGGDGNPLISEHLAQREPETGNSHGSRPATTTGPRGRSYSGRTGGPPPSGSTAAGKRSEYQAYRQPPTLLLPRLRFTLPISLLGVGNPAFREISHEAVIHPGTKLWPATPIIKRKVKSNEWLDQLWPQLAES